MDKINFKLVETEDWVGLYKNNKMVTEGHSIPQHELIKSLKDGYESFETYYIEDLEYYGWHLPELFSDIKSEDLEDN